MNDKRLENYYSLLSCWYNASGLIPQVPDTGLRYMDARYLAEKLNFKPRMIYKLTQQLLDNKEIIEISKSYNGKGFNEKPCSRLYQIDKDIIENYILLIKMKYNVSDFNTIFNNSHYHSRS
jgi:hypothetical protein